MSLATICASVWLRVGAGSPTPGAWIGDSESTAAEIVEFSREALRMVTEAHDWEALTRTYTVALTAAEEQTVALPADYARLVPGTVWLTDLAWPARGPVSEAEYEYLRAPPSFTSGPVFRISGGALQLLYTPAPGGDLTLRYITSSPVANGSSRYQSWQSDSDTALIDERLIVLGTIFLWRDAKGLDAQNAAVMYRSAMATARAQDRPLGVLSMGPARRGMSPHAREDGSVVSRPY